jgi:pyruvate-formate lyase-activating enzyme
MFDVLEPAIDPNNRISFLLDWELTMKCNLDCSYCGTGLYGGHDNSTKHPPLDKCLSAIDFMFEYVDLYMEYKPTGIKYVVLNVYGGESLHHPDIVEILSVLQDKYRKYNDRWHLTVTTTTNAIVTNKKLTDIIPYIDEFTVSYHAESTQKQKQQFKENLLLIKESSTRMKCIVLMHSDSVLFDECQDMINWLIANDINYLPKQLDHDLSKVEFNYNPKQITWFNELYNKKNYNDSITLSDKNSDLADTGRACCGGRQVCKDLNYKSRNYFVANKFPNWYCSVNWFFLHIKQVNGEIFVNKDCKMNFNGEVGPIGNLSNPQKLLADTRKQLETKTMPIIQCKKSNCTCGLCAPKAQSLDTYKKIINKYQKGYI